MPFYHILIRHKNPKSTSPSIIYELDLVKDEVEVFVEQYQKGRVLFKGKWLDSLNIEEVEILETRYPHDSWSNISPLSSVQDITISGGKEKAKAVTRQFIKSEPRKPITKSGSQSVIGKDVFVVHGHDIQSLNEFKKMLVGFGLNPIVLHEQPSGSRTIVEKLEKYSNVGYAFVILTPDDTRITSNLKEEEYTYLISSRMTDCTVRVLKAREEGNMRKVEEIRDEFIRHAIDFQGHVDNLLGSFESRARQNVILEFGYFIGVLGRDRVCCLLKGNVEKPSDMHGIVYIPFKESVNEARNMIEKELREAGYEIKK